MEFKKVKVKLITEKSNVNNDVKFDTPNSVVRFINTVEEITSEVQEYAYLILMNNKNNVINYIELSHCNYSFAHLDMKLIMQSALLSNANKIILVHNHLSGDTTPSNEDIKSMDKIEKACKIMDIQFLDSIIIAPKNGEDINYTSIKEYLINNI